MEKIQKVENVNEFLTNIKNQKIEHLMAIRLDIQYWKGVLGDNPDEEEPKLREELKNEQLKKTVAKNGKILEDRRDFEKIGEINNRISMMQQAEEKLRELEMAEKGVKNYLEHVTNPKPEVVKELEGILAI